MSDEPKSHIFFELLNHPLVKTWMNNTLSPASREAKRQDLTNFISWFKIKSMGVEPTVVLCSAIWTQLSYLQ